MNLSQISRRQLILAAVAGGIVLFGLRSYATNLKGPFAAQQAELLKLEKQVSEQRTRVARAERAAREVKIWEKQSLHHDVPVARSDYQEWLAELIEKVKLSDSHIQPERGITVTRATADRRSITAYQQLPFAVSGQGSIAQLTQFLYEFYSADLLHRVRSLTIQPQKEAKQLRLNLLIDALVLPGAEPDRGSVIPRSDRLALASLNDYQKLIDGRNLFAAYTPPPPPPPPRRDPPPTRPTPPPPPPPPKFDDAKFAVLSAIIERDDQPQVWVHVRTTDKVLKLAEGDLLEVGLFKGRIGKIGRLSVEIESDGKLQTLMLGDTLRQSLPVAAAE